MFRTLSPKITSNWSIYLFLNLNLQLYINKTQIKISEFYYSRLGNKQTTKKQIKPAHAHHMSYAPTSLCGTHKILPSQTLANLWVKWTNSKTTWFIKWKLQSLLSHTRFLSPEWKSGWVIEPLSKTSRGGVCVDWPSASHKDSKWMGQGSKDTIPI